MSQWCRVFSVRDAQPEPARLIEFVRSHGLGIAGQFYGDEQGRWHRAELHFHPHAAPLHLQRFVEAEDDLRNDLNRWAAWVELAEANPHQQRLMEFLVNVQ